MAEETAKKLGYTDEEISKRKHLASNMTLENAIRMGYVDYKSVLNIGKIHYLDSKDNQLIHMDSGTYNSFEVLLGKAQGKNFWGLIDPSLENIERLKNLDTILPGINTLCDSINLQPNKNIEHKSMLKDLFSYIKTTT